MSHLKRTTSLQHHATTWMGVALSWWIVHDEYNNHRLQNEAKTVYTPSSTQQSMMSPTLPIRIIRPNPNLEIAFDVRTRNPIYVLERLDPRHFGKSKQRRGRPRFYEETAIEMEHYRSRLSHYRNSGWDRGHMAPAADFPETPEDTFNLCNVSPQDHKMNLSIWNRLEEWARRVASSSSQEKTTTTYVVTGPLWLPTRQLAETQFEYSYQGLGRPPSLVSVPTHFFKVVVSVNEDSNNPEIVQFACFVVPNHEPSKNKKLEDYVVPWTDLETVTGLQFFSHLVDAEWKSWADRMTQDQVLKYTSSQQHLLTDGSNTRRHKKPSSKKPCQSIQHLCNEGQCRR
jgi:DNA/RNA endonuclease G (NUC1)